MSERKSDDERQNRITPPDLHIVPGQQVDAPPPPESLDEEMAAHWVALWDGPLGTVWHPVYDLKALQRLFAIYRFRDIASRMVDEEGHVVTGSQGQTVDHPLIRRMEVYDREIRHIEDKMGLTPKGRLSLGITPEKMLMPMKRQNRQLQVDYSDDPRKQG